MRKLVWIAAAFLGLWSTACAPLIPRSPGLDPTPPVLRWSVFDRDARASTPVSGSGQLTVRDGTPLTITFFAEDPQGVRRIKLESSGQIVCNSGDGQSVGFLGGTNQDTTLPTGAGLSTSAFMIDLLPGNNNVPGSEECAGLDMSFVRKTVTYSGYAENDSGGSSTATLTIDLQP